LKYTADKVLALVLLWFFSPLLVVIIIGIKLEGLIFKEARGPVLVSEPRISEGKEFRFYKFRKVKRSVWERVSHKRPGSFSFSELQHDPANLTHMGKILKKFYLDEFPQILNVLKGDISFVGPRAHPPKVHYREIKEGIMYRNIMRCGLTGLAAVNKGLDKDWNLLDAEYFKRYSTYSPLKLLFYDLWVMAKTVELVFKAKGY